MKQIKNILAAIGGITVVSTLIFAVPIHTVEKKKANHKEIGDKNVAERYQISAITLPESLNFAGEPVPLNDPEIVERVDREFLVNTYWQSNTLLLLKRVHKYFPIIEPILAKNGIPNDFKYLAVAESGLLNGVSPAGARGFWQIMEATGKEYGLEISANVDERYHLEKSTQAACDYLKKWKEHFGSWTLTAAAYNAGPTRIQDSMELQEADNYYDLLLGEETNRYIFRILALKEIITNPYTYGFEVERDDFYNAVPTFTVEIDTAVTRWADFAELYGISYKILKRYNPWLREPHLDNTSGKKYMIQIPHQGYYRKP